MQWRDLFICCSWGRIQIMRINTFPLFSFSCPCSLFPGFWANASFPFHDTIYVHVTRQPRFSSCSPHFAGVTMSRAWDLAMSPWHFCQKGRGYRLYTPYSESFLLAEVLYTSFAIIWPMGEQSVLHKSINDWLIAELGSWFLPGVQMDPSVRIKASLVCITSSL